MDAKLADAVKKLRSDFGSSPPEELECVLEALEAMDFTGELVHARPLDSDASFDDQVKSLLRFAYARSRAGSVGIDANPQLVFEICMEYFRYRDLEPSGKPDDFEIVTMYSGHARRYPKRINGDPKHNLIVVIDKSGKQRELYRGTEFDEARYHERCRD